MAFFVAHGELCQLWHGREVPVGAFDALMAEVVGEQRQPAAYVQTGLVPVEQCPDDEVCLRSCTLGRTSAVRNPNSVVRSRKATFTLE